MNNVLFYDDKHVGLVNVCTLVFGYPLYISISVSYQVPLLASGHLFLKANISTVYLSSTDQYI